MEDFNWVEMVLAALVLLLPVGVVALRKYVKSTETKIDDKVLEAVEKAFSEKDAE